jgi:hypothetical protein
METSVATENTRSFLVIVRAISAARLHEHEQMMIRRFPSPLGPVDLTFRTYYAHEGFESTVPRELWIEVKGCAPSLEVALGFFPSVAINLVPLDFIRIKLFVRIGIMRVRAFQRFSCGFRAF